MALASLLSLQLEGWLVEFIHGLRAEKRTVIVATHDLHVVSEIATRVYVLDEEHRVTASGPPREVLRDHDLLHRCNLVHYHAGES